MTHEEQAKQAAGQDLKETEQLLDFESDTPLVCNRDQSGDTTCESCQ